MQLYSGTKIQLALLILCKIDLIYQEKGSYVGLHRTMEQFNQFSSLVFLSCGHVLALTVWLCLGRAGLA